MQVWGLGTAHTLHLNPQACSIWQTRVWLAGPLVTGSFKESRPGKDSEAMESVWVATKCQDWSPWPSCGLGVQRRGEIGVDRPAGHLPFLPVSDLLPEKAMAPNSSTLAWKIPWTEEPGKLQSMGLQRVRHN